MNSSPKQSTSSTFEKGLQVLSLFTAERTNLSLTEIAALTEIARPTAYRLVNTLIQAGYLKKNPATKKVHLGVKAVILGHNLQQGSNIFPVVKPVLDAVFLEHGLTVDAILFDGDEAVSIYRREAKESMRFSMPTTSRMWHCLAVGKAVLAFLEEEKGRALVASLPLERKTGRTLCTVADIRADLEATRRRGYSINNEEFLPGLMALGAPLFESIGGRVIGAVSIEFSTTNYTLIEAEKKFAGVIVNVARELSGLLPPI